MSVIDLVRADRGSSSAERRGTLRRAASRRSANWIDAYRTALVIGDVGGAGVVVGVGIAVGGFSWALAALPVAWVVVATLAGAYRPRVLSAGSHDLRAVLLTGVLLLAGESVLDATGLAVGQTLAVAGIVWCTAAASWVRFATRLSISARRQAGACAQRVMLVGEAGPVTEMVERLRRATNAIVPVAVVVPAQQAERMERLDLPVVTLAESDPDITVAAAEEYAADAVLLVPGGAIPTPVWRGIARACEWHGLQLLFAPDVVDVATSAPITAVAGVPVLAVPRPGPAGAGQIAKQIVDRIGAALGLVLVAPLLVAIAIAIRLDSRGSVVFRQVRIGANGAPFKIIKFRTMRTDAEAVLAGLRHLDDTDGPLFKLRNDPRVTRVGRVLRKLSLDELPQLVNVVRGQMSLVGPRPPLPHEVDAYTRVERRRLLVKPGLTGLWQVGGRSELSWADSVHLDIRYVESWSLPLDLRILARTIPAVLRGTGAY